MDADRGMAAVACGERAMNPAALEIRPGAAGVIIRATSADTYAWATRPGLAWPCSYLSGEDVEITLDHRGDLVDLNVDEDIPGDELTAFADDMLLLGAIHLLSLRRDGERYWISKDPPSLGR